MLWTFRVECGRGLAHLENLSPFCFPVILNGQSSLVAVDCTAQCQSANCCLSQSDFGNCHFALPRTILVITDKIIAFFWVFSCFSVWLSVCDCDLAPKDEEEGLSAFLVFQRCKEQTQLANVIYSSPLTQLLWCVHPKKFVFFSFYLAAFFCRPFYQSTDDS